MTDDRSEDSRLYPHLEMTRLELAQELSNVRDRLEAVTAELRARQEWEEANRTLDPVHSNKDSEHYIAAMELIRNRHSKASLVDLIGGQLKEKAAVTAERDRLLLKLWEEEPCGLCGRMMVRERALSGQKGTDD